MNMTITLKKDRAALVVQELDEAVKCPGCVEVVVTIDKAGESSSITIQPIIAESRIVFATK